MDKTKTSVNDLVVTYGVAVFAVVLAMTLGAYTIAGAIAMFADSAAKMPSIFGLFGNGDTPSLVVAGAIATVMGVIAQFALKKIASSKEAGALVASDSYALINKGVRSFCFITAGVAAVAAVAVLLAAVLSISDYTPWRGYLLGETLPLLFTAAGLVLAGVMIDKFVKAEVKPTVLSTAALIVAIIGIVLACVAVLVKSHTSRSNGNSSNYENFYRSFINY